MGCSLTCTVRLGRSLAPVSLSNWPIRDIFCEGMSKISGVLVLPSIGIPDLVEAFNFPCFPLKWVEMRLMLQGLGEMEGWQESTNATPGRTEDFRGF